jgi:hypothetical protein
LAGIILHCYSDQAMVSNSSFFQVGYWTPIGGLNYTGPFETITHVGGKMRINRLAGFLTDEGLLVSVY